MAENLYMYFAFVFVGSNLHAQEISDLLIRIRSNYKEQNIWKKVMNISSSTWNTDGEGEDSDDRGRTLMFLLCHHFSINMIQNNQKGHFLIGTPPKATS